MKWSVLLCSLFLLAPSAVLAEESESAAAEGVAYIVTSMNKKAACIAPVHIRKIDGREVQVNRGGFELEPGKHTMSGSAKVDTSFCKVVGRANERDPTPPLEAEFEAGKEYWIGLDHSASSRKDWKYVIWQVKDRNK